MSLEITAECADRLRLMDCCSYSAGGPWAAEPTALACLALSIQRYHKAAQQLADQLKAVQQADGSVVALANADMPAWPTSLAILAWIACRDYVHGTRFNENIERAIKWALAEQGRTLEPNSQVGHDPRILGWSWAADTHAWMEPTAMFVVALKAAKLGTHQRTREGVRLVTDRLLPTGGSNYGSTLVLGQATLPQVQSTGLAMLALAGEANTDPRIEDSLRYLEVNLNLTTTTSSLCYGLLGLTAHNRRPAIAEELLDNAFERELQRGPNAYKMALMLLASLTDTEWLPKHEEPVHA